MGAAFVHGVDTEEKMVRQGLQLFEQCQVPKNNYQLEVGEVPHFLETLPEDSFDTI